MAERICSRPYVWQPVPWSATRVLTRGWVDGLPALTWGRADRRELATARQLRELGLRPGGQQPAAVLVFGHRHPGRRRVEHASLYRIAEAAPKRTATPAQRAAIEKALAARRTCQRCDEEQPYYLSTVSRLCGPCEDATGFWDDRDGLDRSEAADAEARGEHVHDATHSAMSNAERADPAYVCEDCGTAGQWSCDCWEVEAAKYHHGWITDEDRPWDAEGTTPGADSELADTLQAAESHRRTTALRVAQAAVSTDNEARARLEREATEAAALAELLDGCAAQLQHAAGSRGLEPPSARPGDAEPATIGANWQITETDMTAPDPGDPIDAELSGELAGGDLVDPAGVGVVDLPGQRTAEPPPAVNETGQAIQRAQRALAQIEQANSGDELTATDETRAEQLARWHTDDQAAEQHPHVSAFIPAVSR